MLVFWLPCVGLRFCQGFKKDLATTKKDRDHYNTASSTLRKRMGETHRESRLVEADSVQDFLERKFGAPKRRRGAGTRGSGRG